MTAIQADFLRQRDFLAVWLTHFFVDFLNSGRNVLVALLAISVGLSNAQLGIALLLYNVGSALFQPLFGWLADRIGARWLVTGGIAWMILFFVLGSVIGDWPALIAITIAGLGSGAFHPTGTMVASETITRYPSQATAVFFMGGQLGLFLGPIVAGIVLDLYDRPGYLVLPALALVALVSGWQWLAAKPDRNMQPFEAADQGRSTLKRHEAISSQPAHVRQLVLLSIIIVTGSTVSISTITFAPKLFSELGYAASYVGWLAGLLMMGSAVGGVVGGSLGDQIQGRWIILLGTLGSILPIYFYIPIDGPLRFGLLILAGFFGGMPHTILVLMIQSLFPGRRAFASGLALGFMFFSGSVGSYVIGLMADWIGLGQALQWLAVLPLGAAAAALLLPELKSIAVERTGH